MPDPLSALVVLWAVVSSLGWADNSSELTEVKVKLNEIKTQVIVLQNTVRDQQDEIEGLKRHVAVLEAENGSLKEEIAEASRQKDLATKTLADLQKENNLLREINVALAGKNEDWHAWAKDAAAKFDLAETQIAAMRLEREKRDSLVRLGLESANKVLDLEKKLKLLGARKTELAKELVLVKEKLDKAHGDLTIKIEELERWHEKASRLEEKLVGMKLLAIGTALLLVMALIIIGVFVGRRVLHSKQAPTP